MSPISSFCRLTSSMHRLALLAVVLLPVLAAVAALAADAPAPQAAKAPAYAPFKGDVIFLGAERAAELKMPVTAFNHAEHARLLPCADCHSVRPAEGDPAPAFSAFAGINPDATAERENAYHSACAGCHAKRSAEGKRGPALAQCRGCHTVADPAALPKGAAFKPAFNAPLHERHLMSADFPAAPAEGLAASAILAENSPERCRACHHAPKHSKTEPPRVDACRACHASGIGTGTLAPADETIPPSLRLAAHATCMACHTEKAAKQQAHGPLDCSGCHDKARFLARPQLPADPSLLTMQRPTGVVLTDTAKPEGAPLSPLYPQGPRWPTSMPGVPFNHSVHEKALNCQDCHHTTVKQACIKCHTAYGDEKAKGVTLAQAMHAVGGRNSCVSCHQRLTTSSKECVGCHTPRPLKDSGQSCSFCHRAPAGAIGDAGLLIGVNVPAPETVRQDGAPAPGASQDAISPPLGLGPQAGQNPGIPLGKAHPGTEVKANADAQIPAKELPPGPGAPQDAVSPPLGLGPQTAKMAAKSQPAPEKKAQAKPVPMAGNAPAATPATTALHVEQEPLPGPGAPQEAVSPALGLGPAPTKMPEKVRIAAMSKEYRPVDFEHAKHMEKLGDAIGRQAPALLGLHAKNGLACGACHHHSPALQPGQTPPKCVSCHPAAPLAGEKNTADGRPLLKAAYHQRCMDCHTRMGNEKPKAADCLACHAKREPGEAPVW